MKNNIRKFWIGVASKDHVDNGVQLGICQFCHGKATPARRPQKGDFLIHYSSKVNMDRPELYQKFTAIGIIQDDAPYQVDMGNGFQPFRRNVQYFDAQHVAIQPLIDQLPFIKNKSSWGYVFRYGFFEIDQESFEIIATHMIGYNPIPTSSKTTQTS